MHPTRTRSPAALLLASLLALAAPVAAQAQGDGRRKPAAKPGASTTAPSDILGAWTFATKPYRGGQCTMTGTMMLSPGPDADTYECELTAIEMCSMWGRSVVVQSCKVSRFGNQVSVRSEIQEFLESKPESDSYSYWPDNFALTVQSETRMYGSLVSAATAPVEFLRDLRGVS
jgi:hypothetical protein